MTKKRRRERDRPKSVPGASYDHNKRVLLCYDSDEAGEEPAVEAPLGTGRPGAIDDAGVANYQIPAYDEGEEDDAESDSYAEIERQEIADGHTTPEAKDGTRGKGEIYKNPSTNQRPALGSLSYQFDDEDGEEGQAYADGEEGEAMAYLRAVRAERQGMPSVFNAPKQNLEEELYDSGIGDSRGYLDEDAYIARPAPASVTTSANVTRNPRDVFTAILKQRFLRQRTSMRRLLLPQAAAVLSKETHPTSFPEKSQRMVASWIRNTRTNAPLPAQVQALSQEVVYRLLALIQNHHLARGRDIGNTTSIWIWSLLACLEDVGTMDNDQVFSLRDLGKKAILVQLSFTNPLAAQKLEEVGDQGPSSNPDEIDLEVNEANDESTSKAHDQEVSEHSPARENTLATLDMILVIVGEIYGQRDLLEFRQWVGNNSNNGIDNTDSVEKS